MNRTEFDVEKEWEAHKDNADEAEQFFHAEVAPWTVEVSLVMPIRSNKTESDQLIEYISFVHYYDLQCTEEVHHPKQADIEKPSISTLWTLDKNVTTQLKEIMMYKQNTTAQDFTFMMEKYDFMLQGFGADSIEYINTYDIHPVVKVSILENIQQLSKNNVFGKKGIFQFPY